MDLAELTDKADAIRRVVEKRWGELPEPQRAALRSFAYGLPREYMAEPLVKLADAVLDAIERADPAYQERLRRALESVLPEAKR